MEKQSIQLPFAMINFLLCSFFFLKPQIIISATSNPPYTPTEHILLDCGSSSKSIAEDGQSWDGDIGTKFSPEINNPNISFPATATKQDPSLSSQVPYMTARIIRSQFSYTFPVSPGQKFLRLFFYPAIYPGAGDLLGNQSFFSVQCNQYSLLSNFSASLTAEAQVPPKSASLMKEFIINVGQSQLLNLTFSPSSNSYAFVNGIEVVSIPKNLYMGIHNTNNNPLKLVSSRNYFFELDQNTTAFETMYRLNVGGPAIGALGDTGMFREWLQDDKFIFSFNPGITLGDNMISTNYTSQTPNYTAPESVYTTERTMGHLSVRYNLTWSFQVDSGFNYLLRLHFCEFTPYIVNATYQRVFNIFINNRTAEAAGGADVIRWAGGTGIPVFKDFVLFIPNPSNNIQSKQDLFLSLSPDFDIRSIYNDAILNGLEIFKLNTTDGNLAGPNPEPSENSTPQANPAQKKKGKNSHVGIKVAIIGGAVGGAIVIVTFYLFLICRQRRGKEDFDRKSAEKSSWVPLPMYLRSTKTTESGGSSSLPSDLCRRFLLEEIKSATFNFESSYLIGTGGFGNVYKGYIDNNSTPNVAIKRLNPSSRQGAREFRTEIEMLSNLRHIHLVSLIGFCDDKREMILVYDYMSNGTLRDHLYRTENPPLPWKQRLQICIGAAKGLHYLHSGAKQNIIHRDVKSTNILLDEKWVAKVSDFGLSKLGPMGGNLNHVSTQVKGSLGYVDQEYYRRQQLTDRSDVYSFGVVLLEVLCARPPVVPNLPRDQLNLAEWARMNYKKGNIKKIVDPNLKGQISLECLRSYSEIAIGCLKDQGVDRPAMSDVVWSLEFALQLQEAADKDGEGRRILTTPLILDGGDEGDRTTSDADTVALFTSEEVNVADDVGDNLKNRSSTSDNYTTAGSSDADIFRPESVFSEFMNSRGR